MGGQVKNVFQYATRMSAVVLRKKGSKRFVCTYQKVSRAHYKACNQWRYVANGNGWKNPPRVLGTNLRRSQFQKDWNGSFEGVLFSLSLHHQNNNLQKYLHFYLLLQLCSKKKLYLG